MSLSPALRLLLVSNSTVAGRGYLDHVAEAVKAFLGDGVSRVLFVPYALADRDGYAAKARQRFEALGYGLDSIHEAADPKAAALAAEAVFVGGGNTWRLLKACTTTTFSTRSRAGWLQACRTSAPPPARASRRPPS
jgi:peptidase E